MQQPREQNSQDRAAIIDQNIPDRRSARRDERLMKFIERRVKQRRNEGHEAAPPKPANRPAQSAEEQPGENRVFRHVRGFSHEKMHLPDRLPRNLRIEPAQEWSDEARGVVGRHQVGRAEKHQRHPADDRTPGLDDRGKFQARSLSGRQSLTTAAARVSLAAKMDPMNSEPLLFEPIFQERVWGGRALESGFGKKLPAGKSIGESWEIVDRPEAQSVVRQGPWRGRTLHDLWTQRRREIFGDDFGESERFPLFAKLLDATRSAFASGSSAAPRLQPRSEANRKPNSGLWLRLSRVRKFFSGCGRG